MTAPTVAVTSEPMNPTALSPISPNVESPHDGADNTHDQVADQPESAAAHDLSAKPARDQSDDNRSDESFSHSAFSQK